MSESQNCPRCGAGLPAGAPGGHCISCLLQLGLASDQEPAEPLGAPVVKGSAEKPGDYVGRYKLLQQIGEGGCGVVYMAEQEEPVRRRVALKVIKLGMDTKQVIARFEAERQALALMDHPNIAKVFDAGSTERPLTRPADTLSPAGGEGRGEGDAILSSGRPYFVMELVRGIRITDYCDQQKLSTRQRLELFIQVCQAVQHAHQKGIIHRDLKPSNVLVTEQDGKALPKVIDFGIAKATTAAPLTDKTLFTAFEQFIGTPAYMSPEQAGLGGLDIDTRSDIYSLGVLLYELLTGEPPFNAAEFHRSAMDEILRTIREKEPLRPSVRLTSLTEHELTAVAERRQTEPAKFTHLLRGDLDWIVMKALEKERTRRYETANGLARDIQRHLANEPVVARPPSRLYEFQKTLRRHKFGFMATAAVIMALAIGLGFSTWTLAQERRERERAAAAEREQSRLRQQAEAAQNNEAKLRAKAQVDEHQANIEAAKSKQVARFLEDMLQGVGPSVAMGRDTTMLREILDKTAARVGRDLTNQPEIEIELRTILAETYRNLYRIHEAESMARAALERARSLYGETNLMTARLLVDLGSIRGALEDANGALRFQREGLAIQRQLLPHDHLEIANTLGELADTLRRYFGSNGAEPAFREALEIREKLFGNQDQSLVDPLNGLGLVLDDLGRYKEAEDVLKNALTLAEKDSPGAATAIGRLGVVFAHEGRLTDGVSMLREALAINKKVLGNSSQRLSWSFIGLADALKTQGNLVEAEDLYRQALVITRKAWDDRPQQLLFCVNPLVDILMREHRYDDAEQVFDDLLTPSIVSQPQSVRLVRSRADFLARRGKWQKATADMVKVIEFGSTNVMDYHSLLPLLAAGGDMERYGLYCQDIVARFAGTHDPSTADRIAKDCLLLPASGADLSVVSNLAETAVTVGISNRFLPYFQCTKGLAEYRGGNFTNALAWMQKTIDIGSHRGTYQWDDYLYVEAYAVSAMARQGLKQDDEARAALAKANEIAETKLPKLESGDIRTIWRDWIIAHKLLDEATVLIEGKDIKVQTPGTDVH